MRSLRLLFAGAVLLPLLLAAGCHAAPRSSAWTITLTTQPANPSSNGPTRFQLRVATPAGVPVVGATASLDLVMSTMDMGTTHVALAPQGPGAYTGSGQFAMSGDWDCRVAVALGGRTQMQVFHYKVE